MKYKIETPDGKHGKDLLINGHLYGSFSELGMCGYSYLQPAQYPMVTIHWATIQTIIAAKHIELNSGHNFISFDEFEQMKEDNPDCGLHIATIGGYEMVIGDYRDKNVLEAAQKYAKAQIMLRDLDKMPALECVDNLELIGYCEMSGKPIVDGDAYFTNSDCYFLVSEVVQSEIDNRFNGSPIISDEWDMTDFNYWIATYFTSEKTVVLVNRHNRTNFWVGEIVEGRVK